MKKLILAAGLIMGLAAQANELDNERAATNQDLNGTIVIRVDQRTNQVSMAQTSANSLTKEQAQAFAQNASFKALPASKVGGELDRDGGASSWYWYGGYNGYYGLNWYGRYYNPCYTWNYGYSNYYYYNRWNWNWNYAW